MTTTQAPRLAGKKLSKGAYYKLMVVALDRAGMVVATSKVVHVATKGGKAGNDKKVALGSGVAKKARALAPGKALKLKARAVAASKRLKVRKHVGLRYESSDPAVATVSAKGVVKAKRAGSCTVYCYAQDGACKAVKVKVKGAKAKTASLAAARLA